MIDLSREEAISTLERLRNPEPWEPKLTKGAEKALDMAISALKGFEGMTNGEVMKAVFPNCYMGIDDDEWIVTNIDGRTMFQPEWWNAPYKAESEDKE